MRIVEYERKYAKAVAQMWNMSGESWGDDIGVETEETVIAVNENSENINTWLAVAGDEVVGLCGFSEYREDEGASYISILNVRPDYQGKKVGKALVLKAVEKACQCRWPRLDLYTWPGNTKAVPLYKKCGFFWEDRDDATHLMNFIPYVLRTEVVADFFREADWYEDSIREIAVEPDGRKENGFVYFSYNWQHQGKILKMEFEPRGRGLRLIETDDWLVSAAVQQQNLAFGRDYTVCYRLVNKSGKPLEVSIQGRNDKNISFALERTVSVEDEMTVTGKFHVGEIAEDQNVWHTHPGVCAELKINGKMALLKVGIVPKFPALIRAVLPEKEYFAGSQGQFFLNLENGYNEPAVFKFSLPEDSFIDLEQEEYKIKLAAGEKKAVPVSYFLHNPGLWQGKAEIVAWPESGGTVVYSQELIAPFAGTGSSFGGETSDYFFVVNGRYLLTLQKYTNVLRVSPLRKTPFNTSFMRPQLGLPYSVEFAKTKPDRVEWGNEDGVSFLRALYRSSSRPGLEIERLASLQADGLFWQQWRISNCGSEPAENLWFKTMISHANAWPVLPLGGRIIEGRDGGGYLSSFPFHEVTENWIFSRAGNRGLCWPKEMKMKAQDWLWLEEDLGTLAPGARVDIKPVYLSLDTFGTWQEFREFALKINEGEDLSATDSLEVAVNGGNPFVRGDYQLLVRQHQKIKFEGEVKVSSSAKNFVSKCAPIAACSADMLLTPPPPAAYDLIEVEVETTDVVYKRQAAVFGYGGSIGKREQKGEDHEIITVDNGVLSFSAAPTFGPVVFSMVYKGQEWLDSSFPTPGPKSWWNPWLGGVGLEIDDLSAQSLLKQPRFLRCLTRPDNRGNQWQGLQIEVDIQEHEKFQGLVIRQNILTLPGLGGICVFSELEHKGLALNGVECQNAIYLASGRTLTGSWVQYLSPRGYTVRLKAAGGNSTPMVHSLLLGSARCSENLLFFGPSELRVYLNREIMLCEGWQKTDLVPGKKQVFPPQFCLFTAGDIPEAALEPLAKLRWTT